MYEITPLDGGGFEVLARHPGWMQRAAHLHHYRYTAEQVIVAAHAYGSAKLLHHMQHKGSLAGMSDQLGQRARTNSEQLLCVTRPYGEWKRDPEKVHITPGSVSITSGVWPDEQTSIEPVYYGVGSDLMAFLLTYHQQGEQKHPTMGWLKELVEHPGKVFGKDDARHWSERMAVMLCMQTTDTSIELYWKDDMLAQPPGQRHAAFGAHPGRRGVRRPARREDARRARSVDVRGRQPHRLGALHRRHADRRQTRNKVPSIRTSGSSASPACT